MKNLLKCVACLVLFLASATGCVDNKTQCRGDEGMVRHVVLFGCADDVTEQQVDSICRAFENLPNEIPQIQSFEWGTDCSPEGLQKGLTHCFFLTFRNQADRDAYLPHPAHKAFGKLLGGKLSAITVVDYEPRIVK